MGYEHREVSERPYGQGVGGIGGLFPKPKNPGRPRKYPLREIPDGIFYVLRSGCSWRMMPKDLPQDGLPLLQGVEGGGDLGEDKPGASEEDEEEAGEG